MTIGKAPKALKLKARTVLYSILHHANRQRQLLWFQPQPSKTSFSLRVRSNNCFIVQLLDGERRSVRSLLNNRNLALERVRLFIVALCLLYLFLLSLNQQSEHLIRL